MNWKIIMKVKNLLKRILCLSSCFALISCSSNIDAEIDDFISKMNELVHNVVSYTSTYKYHSVLQREIYCKGTFFLTIDADEYDNFTKSFFISNIQENGTYQTDIFKLYTNGDLNYIKTVNDYIKPDLMQLNYDRAKMGESTLIKNGTSTKLRTIDSFGKSSDYFVNNNTITHTSNVDDDSLDPAISFIYTKLSDDFTFVVPSIFAKIKEEANK